jgi:hypothetical protein
MSDHEDIFDEMRQVGGLAAMNTLDAVIDDDFLTTMDEAQDLIVKVYRHLTEQDLPHIQAVGIIHGIVGGMMERART